MARAVEVLTTIDNSPPPTCYSHGCQLPTIYAVTLMTAVCRDETRKAFENFRLSADKVAMGIINNKQNADEKSRQEVALRLFAARAAVRKELGIDGAS